MALYTNLLKAVRILSRYTGCRSLYQFSSPLDQFQGQSPVVAAVQLRRNICVTISRMAPGAIDDPIRHLDYNQLITMQKSGSAIVVDVREPSELAKTGKIPGSINIPLGTLDAALQLSAEAFQKSYGVEKPATNAPLVFSCASGKRSYAALSKALANGYENSAHYTGGWSDWENKSKQGK